ncbi:beta-1,3-galactosyltransferase 1-like [Penaeus indicus]|uniref:beta-1,3-galactosyltransferase 1-like n=1 Tax=Penaeus indicus TaxID=29960 RepID=UPI00300D036B
MRFLFRKKWKNGKNYAEKLPWIVIQADLLEARLGSSSSLSSRSSSPGPGSEGAAPWCQRWCGRLCLLRLAQFTLLLTLAAAAAHALIASLTTRALPPTPSPLHRPPLPRLSPALLPAPAPSALLDLQDFHFLHDAAESTCAPARLYFVFLVHSRPDHFRQRQAIRATWGGLRALEGGWAARTVFMLGEGSGGGGDAGGAGGVKVGELVGLEARRHGDLVVGAFHDHYHNLTYKHAMALRWAASRCRHAAFVVKADDDAFIDVPALKALLDRTFAAQPPRRTLACHVLPPGTRPQRSGKWAVSAADYPWAEYPRYCAGLAYVASADAADELSRAAQAGAAPRVWVDDVWVTGLLAEALQLQHHYLNLRYSYDHTEMAEWASRARASLAPPFAFAHLDPACPDWRPTLDALWRHALAARNASADAAATDR